MRHRVTRRVVVAFVASLLAVTLVGVPGASGGPPASEKATLRTDRAACTLTATLAWKNYSAVETVRLGIYDASENTIISTGPLTTDTVAGTVSVGPVPGTPGSEYHAVGAITGSPGANPIVSRYVTLRCAS